MDAITDSLEAHLARHTVTGGPIYLVLLLALVLGAAALPIVRVPLSVSGQGIVRPVIERHVVKSASAGVVEEIPVAQHQRIAAGEVLVTLGRSGVEPGRSALVARQKEVGDLLHDLRRLGEAAPGDAEVYLRTRQLAEEFQRYEREASEVSLRLEQARVQLARATRLAGAGLLPIADVEEHAFRVRRLEAERSGLERRYRSAWEARASELRLEAGDLAGRLARVDDELANRVVRAPVAGTIEELAPLSPGSVVQTGQEIAQISPDGDLIAEVYVGAGDVGSLRVGLPVRVLVDAFNHHDWGFVPGRIAELSDDFVLVDQRPMFRAAVELERTHLRLRNGVQGELKKGMTLQARFVLGERTLWQMLRDDLNGWLNPLDPPAAAGRR